MLCSLSSFKAFDLWQIDGAYLFYDVINPGEINTLSENVQWACTGNCIKKNEKEKNTKIF